MTTVQASPDYQSGRLVVAVTYDEGSTKGKVGDGILSDASVGENCALATISSLATSCQINTWFVGRFTPRRTLTEYSNQFALLKTVQKITGLTTYLGHAADPGVVDLVTGSTANPNPFNLAPRAALNQVAPSTLQTLTFAPGTGTAGMTAISQNTSLAASSSPVHTGSGALSFTTNQPGKEAGFSAPAISTANIVGGTTLTGSCHVNPGQSTALKTTVRLTYSNGVTAQTTSPTLIPNAWTKVTVAAPAPNGAVSARLSVVVDNFTSTNQLMNVDDCAVSIAK